MTDPRQNRPGGLSSRWLRRFHDAFDGLRSALVSEESLWVHLFFASAVIAVSTVIGLELWRWCVLILSISLVISLELVNSAIERLVKTLHPEHDEMVGQALHIAAAAVLVASIGAAVVGLIVLLPALLAALH